MSYGIQVNIGYLFNIIKYIASGGKRVPKIKLMHLCPKEGLFTNYVVLFRWVWTPTPPLVIDNHNCPTHIPRSSSKITLRWTSPLPLYMQSPLTLSIVLDILHLFFYTYNCFVSLCIEINIVGRGLMSLTPKMPYFLATMYL